MNKYKLNLDEINYAVLNNKHIIVKAPVKHDFDRCPICNRKYNTEKLPIRIAINKNNEVKPVVFVDGKCIVWNGVKGEEYKFGSIGDSCYYWYGGFGYLRKIAKTCAVGLSKKKEYETTRNFLTKFFIDSKIINKWFKEMELNKY